MRAVGSPAAGQSCARGPRPRVGHRLQLGVGPLVTGGVAWTARCHCGLSWTGAAPSFEDSAGWACRGAGPGTRVTNRWWRPRRVTGQVSGSLLDCDPILVPEARGGSGYTVASDGAWSDGTGWWAWVSDAGWAQVGHTTGPQPDRGAVGRMELAGALHALAAYPAGSQITLLTDYQAGVGLLQRLTRPPGPQGDQPLPSWVDTSLCERVRNRVRGLQLEVVVRWVRRESEPLQCLADRLIRRTRKAVRAA